MCDVIFIDLCSRLNHVKATKLKLLFMAVDGLKSYSSVWNLCQSKLNSPDKTICLFHTQQHADQSFCSGRHFKRKKFTLISRDFSQISTTKHTRTCRPVVSLLVGSLKSPDNLFVSSTHNNAQTSQDLLPDWFILLLPGGHHG